MTFLTCGVGRLNVPLLVNGFEAGHDFGLLRAGLGRGQDASLVRNLLHSLLKNSGKER